MENYRNLIGDGKLPNKYWLFHYDEKMKQVKNEDGSTSIEPLNDNIPQGGLIGAYKTYAEALAASDKEAYYPHVFIEDRISGQVFESICIVCPCCGKEDWETREDIAFTKKKLGADFK